MNSLSTHIITHWAYIEKEDKKYPLTSDQAFALRELLKNSAPSKYITIPDPKDPVGEPLWEGRAMSVTIRKLENKSTAGDRWICDFGIRHAMNESCECSEKYKVSPIDFRFRLNALYPNKYARNITNEERNKILSTF